MEDLESQSQSLLAERVENERRRSSSKVFLVFGVLLVAAIVAAVCNGRTPSPSAANLRGAMNKGESETLQLLFPSGYQKRAHIPFAKV